MNDRDVNPMKTGLMFVPLGWATMSPGCLVTPSQWLSRVPGGSRNANVPLFTLPIPGRAAARRLIRHIQQIAQRQQSSSI